MPGCPSSTISTRSGNVPAGAGLDPRSPVPLFGPANPRSRLGCGWGRVRWRGRRRLGRSGVGADLGGDRRLGVIRAVAGSTGLGAGEIEVGVVARSRAHNDVG